jgi:hypothetical protein
MRYLSKIFLIFLLSGCSSSPQIIAQPEKKLQELKSTLLIRDLNFRDHSIAAPPVPPIPPHYFQDTPQSRAVIAGSKFYATSNYCEFIRRYKLKTNVDFNSAINLFKYRAYFMGASRVVFINSDARTLTDSSDVEIILHPSIPKYEPTQSLIVGDLYECPENRNALH